VASDFLANHNSSHRRGNDAVTIDRLKEVGELAADLFRKLRVLKHESALEVLPAMQTRTQDKVPV
jgi:hypothetical protein